MPGSSHGSFGGSGQGDELSQDEIELLRQARAGHADAFGPLVRRHQDSVFGLISRMVRDRAIAEELTQDVFVRAWRSLEGFRGEARFSTWLYRIALNLCRDHSRSAAERMRRAEVSLDGPDLENWEPAASGSPEEELATAEAEERYRRALAALDPEHQAALVLRHQEGKSYDEIAAIEQISPGNARVRVHRARAAVLRALREVDGKAASAAGRGAW